MIGFEFEEQRVVGGRKWGRGDICVKTTCVDHGYIRSYELSSIEHGMSLRFWVILSI